MSNRQALKPERSPYLQQSGATITGAVSEMFLDLQQSGVPATGAERDNIGPKKDKISAFSELPSSTTQKRPDTEIGKDSEIMTPITELTLISDQNRKAPQLSELNK